MNLSIQASDIKRVQRDLAEFSDRRLRAALATALTRTAVEVRDTIRREMVTRLDRPTPYTLRQLRYVGATADRLAAAVGFNVVAVTDERGVPIRYTDLGPGQTPAGKYLQPQIEGGPRRAKRLEEALRAAGALPAGWLVTPGQGARLDAYGNVSRGQVVQVLSQLRIQLVAGSNRNMNTNARAQLSAQRKAGGRFFVVPPGGKVQPGIYQRELIGRNITPVFIFVRGATYRPRFDFYGRARAVSAVALPRQFQRAVDASLQRLRARAA